MPTTIHKTEQIEVVYGNDKSGGRIYFGRSDGSEIVACKIKGESIEWQWEELTSVGVSKDDVDSAVASARATWPRTASKACSTVAAVSVVGDMCHNLLSFYSTALRQG